MRLLAPVAVVLLALPATALAQDTTPPTIKITHPRNGSVLRTLAGGRTTAVTGKVSDSESGVNQITVNAHAVGPDPDGSFFRDVAVHRGRNTVTVSAVDKAGNSAKKTVRFTYRPPSSGGGSNNVLRDPRGDAHGSPIDLKRATRKKTRRTWIFRIEFWKRVPLSYLYYHGAASGNLAIIQRGHTWGVSGNCGGHCVEAGPGKRGSVSRPNGRTVVFRIRRSLLPGGPWGVFASFGGTAKCPRTGHTPEDTPCKDEAR
jgi:hypothetical protein